MVTWSADGKSLIFKAHDDRGRASFWRASIAGGPPKQLALLNDLARPSNRRDFHADARRIYFTIEDKQSNVWVAEVVPRK